jgi:hypothetical protein
MFGKKFLKAHTTYFPKGRKFSQSGHPDRSIDPWPGANFSNSCTIFFIFFAKSFFKVRVVSKKIDA